MMEDHMARQMEEMDPRPWGGAPTDEEMRSGVEQAEKMFDRLNGPIVDLVSLGAVWSHRLRQDVWIDRNRRETPVADMDPEHRLNVLGYLRRHSARLQHVVELYDLSIAEIGDDMAWETPATPLEWLRAQPLFRALVAAASESV